MIMIIITQFLVTELLSSFARYLQLKCLWTFLSLTSLIFIIWNVSRERHLYSMWSTGGNHCLPGTSLFISVNSSLPPFCSTKFPQITHSNATKTTKNKWENIAGSNWEIFQRKYLGQNGANISFVTQGMESTAIKIAGGANSAKSCHCYRLSTICLLEDCAPSLSTEMSRHYHRGFT